MNRVLVGSAVALAAVATALGGSMIPPVGPVAPTMKTLQQVEPRTPVQSLPGSATGMFVISEPGSYYLTGNIDASATDINGIEINSDNVTLDLNGFTISGYGGAGVRNGKHGITCDTVFVVTPYSGLHVFNGTIAGWREHGIVAEAAWSSRYESVAFNDCGGSGLRSGPRASATSCTAKDIDFSGFVFPGGGVSISNSTAADCGEHGFNIDTGGSAFNCSASGCGVGFVGNAGSTFSACSASFNVSQGFLVGSGATVTGCVASSCIGNGFSGDSRNQFVNCTAANNGGNGMEGNEANSFRDCLVHDNGSTGILVSGTDNTVDGCHIRRNAFGLLSFGSQRNLIIRCRVYDNPAGDFGLSPADYLAPVLTPSDLPTNTNPNANFGF
jgi:parallel beta-helix repeat protein